MTDSSLTYDILMGQGPYRTFAGMDLTSGNNIVRGTVIAQNTSTGKLVPYDSGGSNGANIFYGIAVEDVDASAGDLRCPVYIAGGFKEGGLTFDTSGDSVTEAFRTVARGTGVYLDSAVAA